MDASGKKTFGDVSVTWVGERTDIESVTLWLPNGSLTADVKAAREWIRADLVPFKLRLEHSGMHTDFTGDHGGGYGVMWKALPTEVHQSGWPQWELEDFRLQPRQPPKDVEEALDAERTTHGTFLPTDRAWCDSRTPAEQDEAMTQIEGCFIGHGRKTCGAEPEAAKANDKS